MTNSLVRAGTREYRDPIAYVPYRAPYTYWETREGWRPIYPTPGAVWGYDPTTGIINAFAGPGPWLERFTYNVPITVPGQDEVPGFEGGWVDVPPADWTSFAFSVLSMPGSGNATFKVPPWVRGVAIGMTSTPVAMGAGYGHIPHGFRFVGGHAYSLSTGTDLGAGAESDVWGVTVTGTEVLLKKNGSTVATEASTLPNTALYLAAVLVSVGDMVDEPTIDSIFTGSAAMGMSLGMYAVAGPHAQALMTAPAFSMDAESHNVMGFTMSMFAAESTAGYAAMPFPPVTLEASSSAVPAGPPTVVLPMPPFVLTGYMLTGEIASADMSAPAFSMVGADYAYAGAAMTMPPFSLNAWEEANDEAFAFESVGFSTPAQGATTQIVLAYSGVGVASFSVADALLEGLAFSTVGVDTSAITSQLLDAIAMSFINFGTAALVPGLGSDTWVWNADSKGSTSYSGYGFNSFARIGDRYYGASEEGLFELDGDTDAGAPIRAVISPGKLGFGTSAKKTVVDCYVGMSGEGYLTLKVIAEGQEYLYRTRSFSEEMQQQKIDLGLGLRTNYVTLELFNENGEDFEVDTLEFLVADLSRRIGG